MDFIKLENALEKALKTKMTNKAFRSEEFMFFFEDDSHMTVYYDQMYIGKLWFDTVTDVLNPRLVEKFEICELYLSHEKEAREAFDKFCYEIKRVWIEQYNSKKMTTLEKHEKLLKICSKNYLFVEEVDCFRKKIYYRGKLAFIVDGNIIYVNLRNNKKCKKIYDLIIGQTGLEFEGYFENEWKRGE